jgi:hypothetical protein
MVESHSSSTHDDHHYHHSHYYNGTKQSLSAFEYNNTRDIRGVTDRHVPPRIPDGFKSSRAFDTPMNTANHLHSNKASEQSSLHQRNNNMNHSHTPQAMFIRPTVSTHTNTTGSLNSSRNTYRQTRNTDVSELFLAEAKAAQAKLDMEMDGNSSLDSFNSYAAIIDRPNITRQSSSSSIDAVGPLDKVAQRTLPPKELITLQMVDDTVQIATTSSNAPQQQLYHHPPQPSDPFHRYRNMGENDEDDYDHQLYHTSHRHYRSHRKPLGLAYTLRKTDSGSTFQSLDGLSNSSPLIRHESKKKHQKRSSNSNKSKRKKRSSLSTTSSSTTFTSTINTSFLKCNPTGAFDYSNRFICFNAPTCLPIHHIKESFDDYRHRYYASTAYKNQQYTGCSGKDTVDSIDEDHKLGNNHSPSKQREGPEHSPSPSPTRVNVQQQHQQHIRDRQTKSKDDDIPEISTTILPPKKQIPPTKKISTKNVRFAAPLVTKVHYRPYTPQSEIAMLYFQEEELEELECDRETVTGDQFECQFDEMALAVHIAYQQINPTDE